MTTYETWEGIPTGVTVYAPGHKLLVIKLPSTTLVSPSEYNGRWIQTTGRLHGPFEGLVPLEDGVVTKPEPRQRESLNDVPHGVKVRDNQGDVWKRKRGYWFTKLPSGWCEWNLRDKSTFGPYTEIVK